ncbi:phosphotriesterase [uncultured Friedmanniella sp.]|uniref:phosphotriesterase family protein n=1 Tax=uncultured Friedmanniella sp. TaxID=335381 RepID=UPI0035CBCBA5
MPGPVRTVLGDLDPSDLGHTNYHEHLFQVSPLLPGEELDDEDASRAEAASLAGSGFTAVVDATPTGLGRRSAALARISAATGLRVVATTGAHREPHYGSGHWLLDLTEVQLAERFRRDVVEGMPESDGPASGPPARSPEGGPVRAGVVKAGIGHWSISAFERRVLAAVAATWHQTSAAVMVHLEHGSAAFEVLELLAGHGVPASAVALAHVDRLPDPGLHAELADLGCYLGYDGWARTQRWPDSVLLECLLRAAGDGAATRILLGGDVARRSRYRAYGGLPGLAYLGERVLPRLARDASPELVEALLVTNPARWLAGDDAHEGGRR